MRRNERPAIVPRNGEGVGPAQVPEGGPRGEAAILASPSLRLLVPTERHGEVLGSIVGELPHLGGNILHGAHTAALMREHGIRRIYTRDTDFHRFPFLDTRDSVA